MVLGLAGPMREVHMSGSIGAVLRSTGLVTINRAIEARANRPRAKIWSGSIAVGHEKRVNAYIPIRNARQMREMIEAAKLYERQTFAERRTATPRVRNGAIGQAGIQIKIGRAPSELQSLMRISYAVFCLKKKKYNTRTKK